MGPTKEAFKEFIKRNGNKYPYNDIRCTRRALYPKWILMKAPNAGVLFRPLGYYLVPAKAFSNPVVQDIIVSKDGLPLPSNYCAVAEVVEWWGRLVNPRWSQNVLVLFEQLLREGANLTTKELYYECIVLLAESKLANSFGYCGSTFDILQSWQDYFDYLYSHKTNDFFSLCKETIFFIESRINANTNSTPIDNQVMPVAVSPEPAVSLY